MEVTGVTRASQLMAVVRAGIGAIAALCRLSLNRCEIGVVNI